jgi:hypothetical protein
MSDAARQARSTSILALVFLVLSFAAGLFLAHGRGEDIQPDVIAPLQSADVAESVVGEVDWQAELAAMNVRLTEARASIARLDGELAILRDQQKRIDAQLTDYGEIMREAGLGKTRSSPPLLER